MTFTAPSLSRQRLPAPLPAFAKAGFQMVALVAVLARVSRADVDETESARVPVASVRVVSLAAARR
jgi:hypothetical protein